MDFLIFSAFPQDEKRQFLANSPMFDHVDPDFIDPSAELYAMLQRIWKHVNNINDEETWKNKIDD